MMNKGQHTKKYLTTRAYVLDLLSEELEVSKATVSKYISECNLFAPFDEDKIQIIRDHYQYIRDNEHNNRSNALKGKEPINKGKHHTEETKKKISESRKGIPNRNKGLPGKKHTYDEKLHQSEKMKEWHKSHKGNILEVCEKTGYSPAYCLRHFPYKIENSKAIFDIESITDTKTGKPKSSFEEKEIVGFIKSIYNDEIIENDRKVLDGKELDIYIPGKNVAIEYDGIFWHSSCYNKDKYYHKNKTDKCAEKNIRLIHIFSDEWRDKKDICKSIIASSLGIYEKRIFARECSIVEVSKKEAKQFFEANHIHGSSRMFRAIGLRYRDELVMCCSFRKMFMSNSKYEKCVELARMASKLNTQVIGGFSRLMKYSGYKYVESFVDKSKFNGFGYDSTFWHRMKDTPLDYWYTDGKNRYNRQQFMKKSCLKKWPNSDPSKSEESICEENGLYRIYGCGNMKLYWEFI